MKLQKIFILVAFILLTTACKKKDIKPDNLFKFRDYISYTTFGTVSTRTAIVIGLSKEVEGLEVGQLITDKLVKITPHVEGKLVAENNHTLKFIANQPLQIDKEYTVKVNLKKIFSEIASENETYTFQFKTKKPYFNLETNNLQSYSKKVQYLEAVLKSNDIISLENAKKLVSATQKGKPLQVVWNESFKEANVFEFKIDSIKRFVDDSNILINWNGKAISASNKGENTIAIPGISNFTITNIEVVQTPEQYLLINFSDPLKKQQNFDGLVTIQNAKNPKFIVDGNVLKVYPKTKIIGKIAVDVFQGIKNTENYKLKKTFSETIAFEDIKPQVRLINNGSILPNSKELKFNFEAVNLKAVDIRVIKIFQDNILQFLQDNALQSDNQQAIRRVGRKITKKTIQLLEEGQQNDGKWKAYSIDLSRYFKASPGAIYRVELTMKKDYSLYDCKANPQTTNAEDNDDYYEDEYYDDDYYDYEENYLDQDEAAREEKYWDNQLYRYKNRYYNYRDRKNPCKEAYYQSKEISQNLIASNLGIIVKKGANNSYYFAVSNILTTASEANASIKLFNYQQQEIAKTKTDNQGLAIIDANKHAAFAIVSKGNNVSYIRLKDGNALSLSKFDVSGNHLQKGLKGYIYGERGVWRPGDSLHLTFLLNDNANKLPKGHPVKMKITDPNGKLVYKAIAKNSVNNFYAFNVPTETSYKTGNYNAQVSVGGATFYKGLKIETVKPNRLKINVKFDDQILSGIKPMQGTMQINWLHGAPAKNVRTEIKAKFSKSYTSFKQYKDYVFIDPTRKFNTEEATIFDGKVDENGFAKINKKLNIGENAPGMLNMQILVRAFENGGDFSMDAFTKKYAPYKSFVGLKSPKGKAYGSFFTDTNHQFDIITVDDQGNPIKRTGLEIKIYKIEWRWWWNASYDNLSSYTSSSYHKPYKTIKINTASNGKARFNLNIPDKDKGRFLIRVYDTKSGHATGRTAYFYKNWYAPKGDKEAAKILAFSADKKKYNVGETASITFPSSSEGRALISIENGTEVLSTKWVKTQQGQTHVKIPITKEMAPNVFVNISLLQPHAITANDLPIRLYGIIPLMVEDPNSRLEPQIQMPNILRPEKEFTVLVSEKNKKAMTYTIAVVEEGLLDLTRFKTPNAWSAFYKREALGVKTWDLFDDVIGAYSGSIDQVFAIGGDANASAGKNKKANRFKPVVRYLGPFSMKSGENRIHKIKMPNYIGSVRTMVVAGNVSKDAYGSTEETAQVKKPLMVLATLPRKLSPGEKVTLPITVFAMEPKVKNVKLQLKLSDGIKVVGNQTTQLYFEKPDEQMAFFELDVSKAKGINTVEVIATGGGEKSTYKVEIDVLNPNPFTSKVIASEIQKNQSKDLTFNTFGVYGTNSATVEFSTMPPMDFSRRLQYLIQYPHGCVEQTTSSVFPQLYLTDIFDLNFKKKNEIQKNIENGIKRLGQFQNPSGGLSYWIGEGSANDWGTSYAGHFLLEAEKKGYTLPLTFKSNWLAYQKQAARDWRPSYRSYNSDLAQAYRLYTLALAGSPDLSAMNRLRSFTELSNEGKWRLAAAYALAGQKEASNEIAQTANINFKPNHYNYYTYGSVDRNRAMALETMVLTKDKRVRDLAKEIAKNLSSNHWMSTQSTAYSLLSMAKMIETNGGKSIKLSYALNGKEETIDTKSAIAQRDLQIKEGSNTIHIQNQQGNVVFVRVLNTGKLPLGNELATQRGLSVNVTYKDLKGNPIAITKLQQGQDFVATIAVSNLKNSSVNDIALTALFPSGWEIVNTRFTSFGNAVKSKSYARFVDVKDDRVHFYFDLQKNGSNGVKTFNIMLNASYLGTYYLPGLQAEAMYDDDFLVHTKGQWISVVK